MAIIYLFIFIIGLALGSFANVLILRLAAGENPARGRSKCPHCRHVLAAGDLVPIASFIFLSGRCRYCRKKISWQYPLVEVAAGLLLALAFYFDQSRIFSPWGGLILVRDVVAVIALLSIFVSDWRFMVIPGWLVWPAMAIILPLNLFLSPIWWWPLAGAVSGYGFFALQYYLSGGQWVGGGDVRLGALMGALLGWPNIIVALFIAYVAGAVYAIILLAQKKAKVKTAIPFGVFLSPATLAALFFGQNIINWYLSLL